MKEYLIKYRDKTRLNAERIAYGRTESIMDAIKSIYNLGNEGEIDVYDVIFLGSDQPRIPESIELKGTRMISLLLFLIVLATLASHL